MNHPKFYLASFLKHHNNEAVREMCAKQFVLHWGNACGLPRPRYGWCRDADNVRLLKAIDKVKARRAQPCLK